MAVITMSRQYGSGGNEIAARVCEMLGYRFFDKRLMVQVASEMGLSEREIVDFTEEDYRVRGFLERLLAGSSPRVVAQVPTWTTDITGTRSLELEQLDEEWCIGMVKGTIQAAHERGNTVIVGRGGQAILQDHLGVLHVRIEAPFEVRVQRVHDEQMSGLAFRYEQRAVADRVRERDTAAADYLRRFYGVDWADRGLYHLVIDMQRWDVEAACCLIAGAARCLPAA
jgi:cytidylate kinase